MTQEYEKFGVEITIGAIRGTEANVKIVIATPLDMYGNRKMGKEWEGEITIDRRWAVERIEIEAMRKLRQAMNDETNALARSISDAEANLLIDPLPTYGPGAVI